MKVADPAEEEDPPLSAEVPVGAAGARVDAVCAQVFDMHSRSRIQKWIEDGRLRVNGEVVTQKRTPVAAGDRLELEAQALVALTIVAQDIPLTVVHEDRDIAVINKPAGLTTHPGAGQRDGTLQNALLARFPKTDKVPRAGIVHRLDKDTSGLLVVALTVTAHTRLVEMLARRDMTRTYDAIVEGAIVAGGTISELIGRHPRDRLKMAVVDDGREAVTHYRVAERFLMHSHLRVNLETGRTHQIRVHLAHIRHPIVGDGLYGSSPRTAGLPEALRDLLRNFPRQALHARELKLEHPRTGKALAFAAEPPADMQKLLKSLRAATPK
jgi:23S rRNA pseudouridine1911/1915/1917 synthase